MNKKITLIILLLFVVVAFSSRVSSTVNWIVFVLQQYDFIELNEKFSICFCTRNGKKKERKERKERMNSNVTTLYPSHYIVLIEPAVCVQNNQTNKRLLSLKLTYVEITRLSFSYSYLLHCEMKSKWKCTDCNAFDVNCKQCISNVQDNLYVAAIHSTNFFVVPFSLLLMLVSLWCQFFLFHRHRRKSHRLDLVRAPWIEHCKRKY